jgi:hypothetical protein
MGKHSYKKTGFILRLFFESDGGYLDYLLFISEKIIIMRYREIIARDSMPETILTVNYRSHKSYRTKISSMLPMLEQSDTESNPVSCVL